VLEDHPVVIAVEIVLVDEIGDPVPRRVIEQETAEYRLLGFDRMGRYAERIELGIGTGIHGRDYNRSITRKSLLWRIL
jgi:hypothetical protein